MEEAACWFEAQLRRPVGAAARRYLDGRGLPEAERARFGLGYAPISRTGLKDHLVAKETHPGELVEAALLIAPEDGGAPDDRYRDRIIIPITDGRGRIVSFGGRALDPQTKAKYRNGPETALFHKGSTLYGLPEARKLLHKGGSGGPDGDGGLHALHPLSPAPSDVPASEDRPAPGHRSARPRPRDELARPQLCHSANVAP